MTIYEVLISVFRLRGHSSARCREASSPAFLAVALGLICFVCAGCATMGNSSTQVRGKVVVITGASSGFGKGVALKLAGQGAHVVLAARRTALLEQIARDCEAKGGQALVVTTDVSRQEEMERLAQATLARFGRIDVWINNAAVGVMGRFEEIPLADHLRVVEVDLNSVIYGSYLALQQFRKQGEGTLINISSVDGKIGFPYHSTYAAAKHAVRGLGAALYQEQRLNGNSRIKICTIFPYATDTPWWDHAAIYTGHTTRMALMDPPDKVVDAIVRATVHPRKEIAVGYKAKLMLASQRISTTLTETITGNIAQNQLFEQPAPGTNGPGALYQPMDTGTGVDGGIRARAKAEDAARNK